MTISIRIHRSMLVAVLISILIHGLLLFTYWQRLMNPVDANVQAPPLVMQLDLAKPLTKPLAKPVEPAPAPAVEPPPPAAPKPRPVRRPAQPTPAPKVMTADDAPLRLPVQPPPPRAPEPPQPVPPPTTPAAPTDLASYMAMMRERRRQTEDHAARENAEYAARERQPSEDERRNEIIKRNLQTGTNGLFQIVNMGPFSAQFTFKGWTTNAGNARREFFHIDASPEEDIQRKVVQKMIEIIRRHYQGDFNWESQRLDRVVVLSARKEDNDGLEDFLIAEFFGRRR